METGWGDHNYKIPEQFKSYYVVWKQLEAQRALQSSQMFKSYYVVWKLENTPLQTHTISKFKSYYVVWKLCTL